MPFSGVKCCSSRGSEFILSIGIGGFQPPVTPALGLLDASAGFHGHLHAHAHSRKETHITFRIQKNTYMFS